MISDTYIDSNDVENIDKLFLKRCSFNELLNCLMEMMMSILGIILKYFILI